MTIALVLSVTLNLALLVFAFIQHRLIREQTQQLAKYLIKDIKSLLKEIEENLVTEHAQHQALSDLDEIINGDSPIGYECKKCGHRGNVPFLDNNHKKSIDEFVKGNCPKCGFSFSQGGN